MLNGNERITEVQMLHLMLHLGREISRGKSLYICIHITINNIWFYFSKICRFLNALLALENNIQ